MSVFPDDVLELIIGDEVNQYINDEKDTNVDDIKGLDAYWKIIRIYGGSKNLYVVGHFQRLQLELDARKKKENDMVNYIITRWSGHPTRYLGTSELSGRSLINLMIRTEHSHYIYIVCLITLLLKHFMV
jgi:hypothetical protein